MTSKQDTSFINMMLPVLQLLFSCRDAYAAQMGRLALPVDEAGLERAHGAAEAAAYARWDREKFGGGRTAGAGALRDALAGAIDKEHECAMQSCLMRSAVAELNTWPGHCQLHVVDHMHV